MFRLSVGIAGQDLVLFESLFKKTSNFPGYFYRPNISIHSSNNHGVSRYISVVVFNLRRKFKRGHTFREFVDRDICQQNVKVHKQHSLICKLKNQSIYNWLLIRWTIVRVVEWYYYKWKYANLAVSDRIKNILTYEKEEAWHF